MNRNIILVAVGSLLGGAGRYLIALLVTRAFLTAFPFGTFIVNIAGCLAIGVIYGLSERFDWFSPDLRLFLATGFCGGFTTFSSFAYENIQLLQDRDYLTFGAYTVLSVAVGLLASFLGLVLARA